MSKLSEKSVKLNSGYDMPLVGLGVFLAKPNETQKAVETAIDAGYRHIDTAFLYHNEAEVGQAVRNKIADGTIKREDIFVTTKLPLTYMEEDRVPLALEKSLKALDIGYIDLYLIHVPLGFHHRGDEITFPVDADGKPLVHDVDHIAVWRAMEKAVAAGKVKSIGLSNYNRRQIQNILDNCTIKPANLQVECHLYFQQKPLVEYCHKNGISVAAYAPLGSPEFVALMNKTKGLNLPGLLDVPELEPLKNKYHKSSAQILLRWLTQRKIIVIPKSTNPQRIKENIDVLDFELTSEEMEKLSKLDRNLRLFAGPDGTQNAKDFPFGPNDPY